MKAGRYLKRAARVKNAPREGINRMERKPNPLRPITDRLDNFHEVKMVYDEDSANLEVQRCMTCGSRAVISYPEDCQICLFCERDCPQKAIYVSPEKKIPPMIAWG